ncbi:MAG: PadR family transcriptional regulator [Candidatus Eremiobacteraeota bacterium]|nr:PadR family transcriptional regulator [Candidatus Eremiobacteraeota bacterium]
MGRRQCRARNEGRHCSCEMGNLYRYAEPIILLSLATLGEAHGYVIARESQKHAVTHGGLDVAVVYRTLQRLEAAGRIDSSWDMEGTGPARHIYRLTESGWEHLAEWSALLSDIALSLKRLQSGCAAACRGRAERGA